MSLTRWSLMPLILLPLLPLILLPLTRWYLIVYTNDILMPDDGVDDGVDDGDGGVMAMLMAGSSSLMAGF